MNIVINIAAALTRVGHNTRQWCGLRPSVVAQDRYETKKSVLVFVLQVWWCFVKHGLVTLVVIMILKDTATFQVLFIVSLFCAWNITTVVINSGFHLLKSQICQVPLFTSGGLGLGLDLVMLVLVLRIWSCFHYWYTTRSSQWISLVLWCRLT